MEEDIKLETEENQREQSESVKEDIHPGGSSVVSEYVNYIGVPMEVKTTVSAAVPERDRNRSDNPGTPVLVASTD